MAARASGHAIRARSRTGSCRPSDQAFTLLEAVVVMAIMLVLSAIAIPYVQNAICRYQLESAARNTAATLSLARYQAIRENTRVSTIYATGNPSSYGVDLNGNGSLDATEPRNAVSNAGQLSTGASAPALTSMGANYSSAVVPANFQVTFSAQGMVVQQVSGSPSTWECAGSVYVLYLQNQTTLEWAAVTITPAGRFRVWIYSGSSWSS